MTPAHRDPGAPKPPVSGADPAKPSPSAHCEDRVAPRAHSVRAFMVSPAKSTDRRSIVLLVHENRRLNSHIVDIAHRLALAGFIAEVPGLL